MDKKQIKKLMNSFTLPDSSGNTKLFETHISWVILTDEFAFKIKRPVSFSFVDFSELELREHFCHKEI